MGTFTTNKGYSEPTIGGDPTTWGNQLNANFGILDLNMGGVLSVNVAGSSNVVVSSTQAQNLAHVLTGALTGNILYEMPQVGGFYVISNQTSGAYSLTVVTTLGGSTGVVVPQGKIVMVWSDASNVYLTNDDYLSLEGGTISGNLTITGNLVVDGTISGSGGKAIGEVWWFAGPSANLPAQNYSCYGQAISRTTYASLFTAIGTEWGAGDGSTTFNLPDLRGRSLFGADNMGGTHANRLTTASLGTAAVVGVTGGSELLTGHTHSITDVQHYHTITDPGHNHVAFDSGHTHADAGHTHGDAGHGHSDAGHTHGLPGPIQAGSGVQSGPTNSSSGNIVYNTTNSGNASIQTGYASIETSYASIETGDAAITVENSYTGITASNYAYTGITGTNSTGSGASQNVPPLAVGLWVIYAGA